MALVLLSLYVARDEATVSLFHGHQFWGCTTLAGRLKSLHIPALLKCEVLSRAEAMFAPLAFMAFWILALLAVYVAGRREGVRVFWNGMETQIHPSPFGTGLLAAQGASG